MSKSRLFDLLNLDLPSEQAAAFYEQAGETSIEGVDAGLMAEAEAVYERLQGEHHRMLG